MPFRDRELERDEVEAGDQLGDRVLHLESRVHLEEPERAVGRRATNSTVPAFT